MPIPEGDFPFKELPPKWSWVRLGDIAISMADGPFGSNLKSEHYTTEREARIIQLGNIGEEGWREENTKYTTFKHAEEKIARSIVNPGDIVIAKMMPAGRAIICPNHEKMFVLSSDAIKVCLYGGLYTEFVLKCINSPYFRNKIAGSTHGMGRVRTNISALKDMIIPLPPYAEQKRIVEKLDEVLSGIERLKK